MHDAEQEKDFIRPLEDNELILPPTRTPNGEITVIYEIVEYDPLLDSSDMSYKDWIKIAEDIGQNYHKYDGFVVLHGTDTLAYTSSALSFMLEGLKKPVIVTGSQISIFETRSDAKDNFLSSLILAGCYRVPEVCVFFANKLLRGNRTMKVDSNELDAFASPNYCTLADVGIDVKLNRHYIRKPDNCPFAVRSNLNPNAVILTFCPTITDQMLKSFLKPPSEGLVLQSYGTGNLPSQRADILEVLKDAVKREILIILDDIGVISVADMTAEAALTKLIYILGIPKITYEDRVKVCTDTNL
ncbi:hypothetical protein NQ318_001025 [Aromia moschata]|uniref:asparaginase n=1 Tax=Aromia moschata TaxID=1265417 RepID=A0AAV8ZGD8_9CUCU|nr:hypothetical protein NQ318_001025 [Aromia moschata]